MIFGGGTGKIKIVFVVLRSYFLYYQYIIYIIFCFNSCELGIYNICCSLKFSVTENLLTDVTEYDVRRGLDVF